NLFDAVITDPPYYNSIGYSVIMDFFYVWLRRTLYGLSPQYEQAFAESLSPSMNPLTSSPVCQILPQVDSDT
ncbi:MAG: hypothetical protein ACXVB2_23235, partial [Isosphaeraceae bacterium]